MLQKSNLLLNSSINYRSVDIKKKWKFVVVIIIETLLPVNFCSLQLFNYFWLIYAFVVWFKDRHVSWISFGLAAFTLAILWGRLWGSTRNKRLNVSV